MYAEKNVSQCHIFNRESNWTGLGSKSGLLGVGVGHIYKYIYIYIYVLLLFLVTVARITTISIVVPLRTV